MLRERAIVPFDQRRDDPFQGSQIAIRLGALGHADAHVAGDRVMDEEVFQGIRDRGRIARQLGEPCPARIGPGRMAAVIRHLTSSVQSGGRRHPVNEATLSGRRRSLAQIAARDLDIAVIGQLAATELSLDDHLEARPLQMKRFQAALGRRAPNQQMLEDTPADPRGALVGPQGHAELDAIAVGFPPRIFGDSKKCMAASGGKASSLFLY